MSGFLCSMVGTTVAAAAGRTAVPITAVGNAQVDTTQKKFGTGSLQTTNSWPQANYLNGAYNNATVQAVTNIPNYTNYTVEYWIRLNNLGDLHDGDTPFSSAMGLQNPSDWPGSWSFGPQNSGKVRFSYFYNSSYSNYAYIESTTTLSTATWYHLAFVKTGTGIKVYINGTERASGTLSGTMYIANHGLTIGSYYRARPTFWIDEIRISSTNRYTSNFTSPTAAFTNDANTLMLLHCDGADTSTIFTDDNA